ncbi:thioredoxin domain-containing protein [Corynebacterium choanae]|uniref:Disulfide bond formation protein D n=1 Tax=Corynebacterium choanae TaxID=1862358 RepID=A0A3G6J8T9_9CORY|nr:thioredoxin domain-containing protein [Corynebacterium choanae]AZA14531.1 Disulfide bond formation protein D precursor [Corynebacterium choanae]
MTTEVEAATTTSEESKRPVGAIIIAVIAAIVALGIFLDGRIPLTPSYAATPLADGTYDAEMWGPQAPPATAEQISLLARRDPTDPFALGAVDAPVVLVEYSDFECPFCANWANTIEPTLIADYVNTGKLRIEWNDFPVNGAAAVAAAKAGRAAAEQGKFNEFKAALYAASADVSGHPNNDIDDFVSFAATAGVPDLAKFREDATSDKYDDAVTAARNFAIMIGIQGTPTFLIGDTPFGNTDDVEAVKEVIDAQLAAIESGKKTPTEVGDTDGRDYPELVAPPVAVTTEDAPADQPATEAK